MGAVSRNTNNHVVSENLNNHVVFRDLNHLRGTLRARVEAPRNFAGKEGKFDVSGKAYKVSYRNGKADVTRNGSFFAKIWSFFQSLEIQSEIRKAAKLFEVPVERGGIPTVDEGNFYNGL
jgi:hypothetical protein